MTGSEQRLLDAVVEGNYIIAHQIIDSGNFDINECDRFGRSPLHVASLRGDTDLVELLLTHDIDIDLKDRQSNTALHLCGHIKTINVLVQHGAKLESRNNIGATPKEMAKKRGVSKSVIKFFESLENKTTLHIAEGQAIPWKGQAVEHVATKSVPSVWYEFSEEMGIKRLLIVLLGALLFSLYIAYSLTGVSKQGEMRIPIVDGEHHVEL